GATQDVAIGTDATASLLGYQSQPTDPTTGLVDMGARLYDPTQGRFTSEDSAFGNLANPVTRNQYIYANDSPMDNTDPTGHYATCSGCNANQRKKMLDESAAGIANSEGDSAVAQRYEAAAAAIDWYAPVVPIQPAAPRLTIAALVHRAGVPN